MKNSTTPSLQLKPLAVGVVLGSSVLFSSASIAGIDIKQIVMESVMNMVTSQIMPGLQQMIQAQLQGILTGMDQIAKQTEKKMEDLQKIPQVSGGSPVPVTGVPTFDEAVKQESQCLDRVGTQAEMARAAKKCEELRRNLSAKDVEHRILNAQNAKIAVHNSESGQALEEAHKAVLATGRKYMDPSVFSQSDSVNFHEIEQNAGANGKSGGGRIEAFRDYLTPPPIVYAGVLANYDSNAGGVALDSKRLGAIVQALAGSTPTPLLPPSRLNNENGHALQMAFFTTFARQRLAESVIRQMMDPKYHEAMRNEFRMIGIPGDGDSGKGAVNELVLLGSLVTQQKTMNVQLMHTRRLLMEQTRLLGVLMAEGIESGNGRMMQTVAANSGE